MSTREELARREIPRMEFSDGSAASMTGVPAPAPYYLNATGRALRRFAVEGNAIITGGAGDLALVSARALLEHGLSGVSLWDVGWTDKAIEASVELMKDFPKVNILRKTVDVTVVDAVQEAMEMTFDLLGDVKILCTFAGVVGCEHTVDAAAAKFRRTIDINTTGTFLVAQAFTRRVIRQRTTGSIVFIASVSAYKVNFPQPQAAYNASKAALVSLKSSLAAEWAVHGIRVNTVSPGYMDTALNEGPGLEEARQIWLKRNPMGRMGIAEELTGMIVLLCSQAGSYITGADMRVDGGQCCI